MAYNHDVLSAWAILLISISEPGDAHSYHSLVSRSSCGPGFLHKQARSHDCALLRCLDVLWWLDGRSPIQTVAKKATTARIGRHTAVASTQRRVVHACLPVASVPSRVSLCPSGAGQGIVSKYNSGAKINSTRRANSNHRGSLTASGTQAMAAPPVNRAMKSRAAAPAPAASGECRLASPCGPEKLSRKSPADFSCLPAAAPKSARTGAAAQAPAKSMRQLNKENEDLQIKVEELSSSLHSAQAGKQAAKAAFEVSRLRFRVGVCRRLASCGS